MTFDWISVFCSFFIGIAVGASLSPIYHGVSAYVARRRVLVMDYDNPCGSDCLIRRQPYMPTDVEIKQLLHDLDEAVIAGEHGNPRPAPK